MAPPMRVLTLELLTAQAWPPIREASVRDRCEVDESDVDDDVSRTNAAVWLERWRTRKTSLRPGMQLQLVASLLRVRDARWWY